MTQRVNDRPRPPRPDLCRRPKGGFGWLDSRLIRDHWVARIGPNATAVLVLLAVAADGRGSSYWGRAKMTRTLRISRSQLDTALSTLLRHRLVALRPWRAGHPDGVWQLLPIPGDEHSTAETAPTPTGDDLSSILRSLGLNPS